MIHPIALPAFSDNYIWLLASQQQRSAICVDPGDAKPVLEYLNQHQLTLTDILITHHHADHIGGLAKLLNVYPNCQVLGPSDNRIPYINTPLQDKQQHPFADFNLTLTTIATPGHTLSHLCYYLTDNANNHLLFCGDTLFSGGCGRLFEGSAEQMLNSLNKLMQLPAETKVYCAHEYTRNNLDFYQSLATGNTELTQYIATLNQQSERLSLPSTIKREKNINPFVRTQTNELKAFGLKQLGNDDSLEIFKYIRQLKDNF